LAKLDGQVATTGTDVRATLAQTQATLQNFSATATTLRNFINAQQGLGEGAGEAFGKLAEAADVIFVGVGQMSNDAPLLADGFVSRHELDEMQAAGAVGEVAGWVFDSAGNYLDVGTNRRTGGVRIAQGLARPSIGIAAGASKVAAIAAALQSRIIKGLVTDEATASAILRR
jgi:DNA-binding transcriptional regulator LsrR (DeoR family)